MNRIDSTPRPLEFTPIIWIALLIVGLLGVQRQLESPEQPLALSYLEGADPLILRFNESRHRFPILGIEVEVSDGWTYLSVAEDVRASSATFVHKRSHSILRLEPFRFRSWPPGDAKLDSEPTGESELQWAEIDHRRVGRLRRPPVDLAIFAITHRPHAELNREVRDFCARIHFIR